MIYNDQITTYHDWPPLVRYPKYYSNRRLSILWFLGFAIISLILSVVALIIVFAVEHSWFHDNYNGGTRYGLWRLCFNESRICESWFVVSGINSQLVTNRLNESKAGINAWQALAIIFLFLTTSALIIAIASFVLYKVRNSFHYYLAILASFCCSVAAMIGIAELFVFGFAVYNISKTPRDLDWCFYVNLVAVILAVIASILLSIYDRLVRKPLKPIEEDPVIETFGDLTGYQTALSPSTFVVVRRNRKQRNQPYDYPQILHPNSYISPISTNGFIVNQNTKTDYVTNANHQMLTPYTSITSTREVETNTQQQQRSITPHQSIELNRSNIVATPIITRIGQQPPIINKTQSYQSIITPYQSQPRSPSPTWQRTNNNIINHSISYPIDSTIDSNQNNFYYPSRTNVVERTFTEKQEPRILHYYTGYDYFATVDPSDAVLTRHHSPIPRPASVMRYSGNPSFYPQDDYLKSTL